MEEFSDRCFDLRSFFEWMEENPDMSIGVNFRWDFYEDIREAVNSYYGIASDLDASKALLYTLQHNAVVE